MISLEDAIRKLKMHNQGKKLEFWLTFSNKKLSDTNNPDLWK